MPTQADDSGEATVDVAIARAMAIVEAQPIPDALLELVDQLDAGNMTGAVIP